MLPGRLLAALLLWAHLLAWPAGAIGGRQRGLAQSASPLDNVVEPEPLDDFLARQESKKWVGGRWERSWAAVARGEAVGERWGGLGRVCGPAGEGLHPPRQWLAVQRPAVRRLAAWLARGWRVTSSRPTCCQSICPYTRMHALLPPRSGTLFVNVVEMAVRLLGARPAGLPAVAVRHAQTAAAACRALVYAGAACAHSHDSQGWSKLPCCAALRCAAQALGQCHSQWRISRRWWQPSGSSSCLM